MLAGRGARGAHPARGRRMLRMLVEDEDIDRRLEEARKRLEAFEDAVTDQRLLRRLEQEWAFHPLLLVYKSLFAVMALGLTGCFAILATPMVSMQWARTIAAFEVRAGWPAPALLLFLSLCVGAVGYGIRYAAILRGARSPLLPDELREHQVLASELAHLTSRKRMAERGVQG